MTCLLGRLYQNISLSVTWKPRRVMSPSAFGIGWHNAPGLSCHLGLIFWYVTLEAMWYMYSVNMLNCYDNIRLYVRHLTIVITYNYNYNSMLQFIIIILHGVITILSVDVIYHDCRTKYTTILLIFLAFWHNYFAVYRTMSRALSRFKSTIFKILYQWYTRLSKCL